MNAILPTLVNRKWKILIASEDSPVFIACDNPVALMFSDSAMRDGIYGAGHGMPGTEVLFPVSSRVALIGTFEGSDETINVGAEIVASFNGAMIAYCNRQVYARDSEFVYLRQNGERPRRGASVLNDIHFCKKRQ